MEMIRFAVIGCGMMGQRHADIIKATEGADLVCVMDTRPDNAKTIAEKYGVEALSDYDAALARKDVDAVVLCLPSGLHADFGMRAAKAGKHIITEKPIDINPQKAQELIDTCKSAKVICAIISQNRFSDDMTAVKKALTDGVMGKPVLARASVKWYRHDPYYTGSDWRGRVTGEGGGVLMNQAIHNMDLLVWLFGKPLCIKGMTEHNREVMETEDVGAAIIRFPNKLLCTFEASTSTYPGFEETIEVHSQCASAILKKGKLVFWKHDQELAEPKAPDFAPPTEGLEPRYVLFQRQYRNILATMRGEEELLVKPEEALAVVESILEMYK
ncbi:MAG: Gfo/Idh/MocA family oxidoreductase [Candidatus Sumerlaeales bacterium]|nr:Gfo/Idh/MocA family oxidoreductase [Candidatus Sumerlaeales bacterium]